MNFNICQVCDSKYAILNAMNKDNNQIAICLTCFKEEVKNGNIPKLNEQKMDYLKEIVSSVPTDANSIQEVPTQPVLPMNNEQLSRLQSSFLENINALKQNLSDVSNLKIEYVKNQDFELAKEARILEDSFKNQLKELNE